MKTTKKKILNNKNIVNIKYLKLLKLFQNINHQKKYDKLLSFLYIFSGKIIFSLKKKEFLKYILKILIQNDIHPQIENIINFKKKINYFYIIKEIKNGLLDRKNNILFICTKDLLPNVN